MNSYQTENLLYRCSVCLSLPEFSFIRSFSASCGVASSPSSSTAPLPSSVSALLSWQFVRICFLLRERTGNAYGIFLIEFCCHFMHMLYKIKVMRLFLLVIALIILEAVTGYCLGFDCDVIYLFKIPWLLFTSGLWMLILMCRARYCPLGIGNETIRPLLCIPGVQMIIKEFVVSLTPQCSISDCFPFALPGRILAFGQNILEVHFNFFFHFFCK